MQSMLGVRDMVLAAQRLKLEGGGVAWEQDIDDVFREIPPDEIRTAIAWSMDIALKRVNGRVGGADWRKHFGKKCYKAPPPPTEEDPEPTSTGPERRQVGA